MLFAYPMVMTFSCRPVLAVIAATFLCGLAAKAGGDPELLIYDNDWNIPGSYIAQSSIMPLVTSPKIKILGFASVSGDCWRDEGTVSLLKFLEDVGLTDIPVVNGAVFPLVNTRDRLVQWEKTYGFIYWKGCWNDTDRFPNSHPTDPYKVATLKEGMPTLQASTENAVTFMIRQVHAHPHQVIIYEGGPLTNIALAIGLDPEFAGLAKELVFQGGRLRIGAGTEGLHSDFNIAFDPEAAHIALAAPWAKIISVADVSDEYPLSKELIARLKEHPTPAIDYLVRNQNANLPLWEDVGSAIIADPSLVTKSIEVAMDVDIDHGMTYGMTFAGSKDAVPRLGVANVTVIQAIDSKRFLDAYVAAMQTVLKK